MTTVYSRNIGSMIMPALKESGDAKAASNELGIARDGMDKKMRTKLWIDFDRDEGPNQDLGQVAEDPDDQPDELDGDVDELQLNNKEATETFLARLFEHVKNFDSLTQQTPLSTIEFEQVLLTGPKAKLLAQILALPNCRITNLSMKQCRVKSDEMAQIFGALAKNQSVENLELDSTNIPRDSIKDFVAMVGSSRSLKMMTLFNAGLNENTITTLAPGFEQKNGIIYLDLRQNTFESDGFQKLASSLTGQSSLLTLRINGMSLGAQEVIIMQKLFSDTNCRIENLEMEELNVLDGKSADVIQAVSMLKRLFTFDFSNNRLQPQMNISIVTMIEKYPEMEILCLDHCGMTDAMCKTYFHSMQNTKLQFLNISWNQITGDSMEFLVHVINLNQELEKLAMQHNRFGTSDLVEFSEAIANHKSLKYLDISANRLGNQQFIKVFAAVQSATSLISTFHCRKNNIGGNMIDHFLNCKSRHLKILDLTQNRLSEHNGKNLLKFTMKNVTIEKLEVGKNLLVGSQVIKDIIDECRQNILIKKKILKLLPKKIIQQASLSDQNRSVGTSQWEYDVSEVVMQDQRLEHVDFIQKFIRWNVQCTTLKLYKLDLSRVQDKLKQLFNPEQANLANLQILHVEECNFSDKSIRKFVRSLRQMYSLKSLHLINLVELEPILDVLGENIRNLEHLTLLDLQNTLLKKRDIGSLVPLLTANKVLLEVNIRDAIISKKNMMHLWMALHYNVSVCDLKYSRVNFFAVNEIMALDAELALNIVIRDQVKPKIESCMQRLQQQSPSNWKMSQGEIALRGFQFTQSTNPAVIKYIKSCKDTMRSLDLSATRLRSNDLTYFINEMSDPAAGIRLESLNLSENLEVNDEVIKRVCLFIKATQTLQKLYLDKTSITIVGLKQVLQAITIHRNLRTISIKDNDISLTGQDGLDVVELLTDNISLTTLDFANNNFDAAFQKGIKDEFAINDTIVEHILPQLDLQEKQSEKKKKFRAQTLKTEKRLAKKGIITTTIIKKLKSKQGTIWGPIEVDQEKRANQSFMMYGVEGKSENQQDNEGGFQDQAPGLSNDKAPLDSLGILKRRRRNSLDDLMPLPDKENGSDGQQSSESDSSDANSDNGQKAPSLIEGGFKLRLGDRNLKDLGMDFVTKFARVFKTFNDGIDQSDNQEELQSETQAMDQEELNKYIKNVCIKKKEVDPKQDKIIVQEIAKNIAIHRKAMANAQGDGDSDTDEHDALGIPFLIKKTDSLQTIDLSNSDLREVDAVKQLCDMIKDNTTMVNLVLQNCSVNGKILNVIADALTQTSNINLKILDITNNPIQDPQYKVLYGLLMNNENLQTINYTLYDENNVKMLADFKTLQDEIKNGDEFSEKAIHLKHLLHGHHAPMPLWQKIIFPIGCWKALIHDKHEAFRFKYDTKAINNVERQIMPGVKQQLYWWSIIYYFIVFIAPYFFINHDCTKTFSNWLFLVYGIYATLCAIWEIWVVFRIQKLLDKPSLLEFNKWHWVELFMGMIARTDTFLDVCFVHLIADCFDIYLPWVIPSLSFAVLNLIFPAIMLFYLLFKKQTASKLVQPYLEDTCFASFIRENMLLATVLDSFCIDNSVYIGGRPFVFGKLMGFVSFATQDFPQLSIHIMFKIVIINDYQYVLKKEKLLLIGMCVSGMAVLISIFNMVMCTQNEFDPLALEKEMNLRKDAIKEKQNLQIQEVKKEQRKVSLVKQTDFKLKLMEECVQLGLVKRDNLPRIEPKSQKPKESQSTRPKTTETENVKSKSSFFDKIKSQYDRENEAAADDKQHDKMTGYLDQIGQRNEGQMNETPSNQVKGIEEEYDECMGLNSGRTNQQSGKTINVGFQEKGDNRETLVPIQNAEKAANDLFNVNFKRDFERGQDAEALESQRRLLEEQFHLQTARSRKNSTKVVPFDSSQQLRDLAVTRNQMENSFNSAEGYQPPKTDIGIRESNQAQNVYRETEVDNSSLRLEVDERRESVPETILNENMGQSSIVNVPHMTKKVGQKDNPVLVKKLTKQVTK